MPGDARSQDPIALPPSQVPSAASVEGRVVTPGTETEIPLPGVMVTLHRVGPDGAGPLDSVRTDASGRYAIRYRRFGSDEALYFAAAVHRGIAYFSAPLHAGRAHDEDGEITVFDTTSRAMPFTVQGHHIVVGAPRPDGAREVVEVWELSNDTTVTVVGRDSLSPVWSAPLPKGATGFAGGQGDVAPQTLEARDGRALMLSPFGPGVKQLSYSYSLRERDFPLALTLDRPIIVFEVLLEEPGAQARSVSLRAQGNVTTDGRVFKRFLAQSVPAGEQLRIDVPVAAAGTRVRVVIGLAIVITLAMAAAFARALRRTRRAPRADAREPVTAEALVAAIAALDARHEAGDPTLDDARYADDRSALKARLADALATEGAPT